MCLILFSYRSHPVYPIIIAANRDEFYARPTSPASFWKDAPDLLAGRDLKDGGTWLGITRSGRVAAITNYRDPGTFKPDAPSRGGLVSSFLLGDESPEEYLLKVNHNIERYNGFNLILGAGGKFFSFASTTGAFCELKPGMHGLSNHLLDTPWPKVERGKRLLAIETSDYRDPCSDRIFDIMADGWRPEDRDLPKTGVTLEWERKLSSIFIGSDDYGTRSSTIILMNFKGEVSFIERTFSPGAAGYETKRYELRIPPGAYNPQS